MQWLYLNGDLVHEDAAGISALDPGAIYGRTLVETFAFREAGVFRLEAHYQRLCTGGQLLGIPVPFELPQLEDAIEALIARNGAEEARLRLSVTAGPEGGRPNVILSAAPLGDYPPKLYERGMRLAVSDVRRNETSPLSRIKCGAGLLDGLLARENARAAGLDEAIMLNSRGSVAEAGVANVFIVHHGRVLTPSIDSGALPGITRAAVLSLARDETMEATEIEISPRELSGADEVFLTNSIMGIMPVSAIAGERIQVGPVTAHLRAALHRAASGG